MKVAEQSSRALHRKKYSQSEYWAWIWSPVIDYCIVSTYVLGRIYFSLGLEEKLLYEIICFLWDTEGFSHWTLPKLPETSTISFPGSKRKAVFKFVHVLLLFDNLICSVCCHRQMLCSTLTVSITLRHCAKEGERNISFPTVVVWLLVKINGKKHASTINCGCCTESWAGNAANSNSKTPNLCWTKFLTLGKIPRFETCVHRWLKATKVIRMVSLLALEFNIAQLNFYVYWKQPLKISRIICSEWICCRALFCYIPLAE